MEKVDIIDEDLKVLYPMDKKTAHDRGLLHATIISEVINSKGQWLLVRQAGHKQDPGRFVSPVGGHVSSGETFENALKREAAEEIGFKNFRFKFIGRKIYRRKWEIGMENHYFIVYEIYSDGKPVLNDESVEYKRFSVSEIKDLLRKNPDFFGKAFHFVADNFYKSLFRVDPV